MFEPQPAVRMDKWLKVSIVVAVLLAGAGAFYRDSENTARQADERRTVVEECQRAARMVYDVHWAAACAQAGRASPDQADGHAECDLPDDKAAVVNAWLDHAEQRCLAEARAGLVP
jgi:hypothetical protein